ncbi:elongation factor P maturation arginine rhamnosyltransferase EarP [Wielerella bovis]|uniref:elongation factor P maturation arginine rhamnosyltransferase EarP n=1 Tax=Wielerella bovis TaxID=2917790 RepID=UPI0020194D70|nr:elongation factor P maturation arginine rhamnosyltransferase EarP [Wielerella bovis]ULJ59285.1 elongation factor P maturation arginine rhamnosyltransferase EarP [Wielerella bovis]
MSSPTHFTTNPVCWLFCTVIDNFGDIGVSWRLAQELHTRLGWEIYLFVDDVTALQTILPDAPTQLPNKYRHIHLRDWREREYADFQAASMPNIIIEMFACDLPEDILHLIRSLKPIWLNWEYLSAEDWAIRTHTMPSFQADGSQKYFWQMGFVPQSGGLLREQNYVNQYADWIKRQPEKPVSGSPISIFAFGYSSEIWAKWCEIFSAQSHPIILRTAGTQIISSLKNAALLPENALIQDTEYTLGSLKIIRQDFVPQEQFDELLWASDINIIRGEDSFIRAQYAATPFLWHIYPQAEMVHLDKLDAFWQTFWQHVPNNLFQAALTALSDELNGASVLSAAQRAEYWTILLADLPEWQRITQIWQQYLWTQSDAVTRLAAWLCDGLVNP